MRQSRGLMAALWWPAFGLRVQMAGLVDDVPAALLDREPPRGRVLQVNPEAFEGGVRVGMRAADAQGAVAGLMLEVRQADLWSAAMGEVLTRLQSEVGPLVHPVGPGLIHLGLEAQPEREEARSRFSRVDRIGEDLWGVGYDLGAPQIGVASTRCASRAAACFGVRDAGVGGAVWIARGEEARWLAPRPLHVLPIPRDAQRTLARLGVRRVEELVALGERAVGARFGAVGQWWVRLARGEDPRALRGWQEAEAPSAMRDLTGVPCEEAALANVFEGAVRELCAWAECRGVQLRVVEVRLRGRSGSSELELVTGMPTASASAWRDVFVGRVGTLSWVGEWERMEVCAQVQRASVSSVRSLLEASHSSVGRLEASLSRIKEECPDAHMYQCESVESRWPAARAVSRPPMLETLPPRRAGVGVPPPDRLPALLRMWRPPRLIRVRVTRGQPSALRVDGRWEIVQAARGPWFLSGDWWREPQARFYWDVGLAGRGWWRIFQEPWPEAWFWEATYE